MAERGSPNADPLIAELLEEYRENRSFERNVK